MAARHNHATEFSGLPVRSQIERARCGCITDVLVRPAGARQPRLSATFERSQGIRPNWKD